MPTKTKRRNGIHLEKSKNGQYIYSLWWNGKSVNIGGESYKRKAGAMKSLKRAQTILNDYFIMNHTALLHDETLKK